MKRAFKVPIRNVFCMLSYVNDYPEFANELSEVDEELITYDFLAKRFLKVCNHLIKNGLLRNYITQQEETNVISGKMKISDSLPFIIEKRPIVVCEKDYFSANILFNQIMRATLKSLYQNPHVKELTRKECFMKWEQLETIDDIELTREVFIRIYFTRHNIHYKSMIHLARLLYECILLSHKEGDWSLFSVDLSETTMNKMFEDFLFHFYRIEQSEYSVRSEVMTWNLTGDNKSLLPTMRTDLTLTNQRKNKQIVIDAKFYKNIFQRYHDKNSFHSNNLYQMFAYMMHQPIESEVRGILIYPANQVNELQETYDWDERMRLEIHSINLNSSWKEIKERLLKIL